MDMRYEFISDYDRQSYSATWMNYFFNIAREVAEKSKDPSTKVGAILVDPETKRIIGTGYNGFPARVAETFERWQRPIKYSFVCHAEMNVIAAAAKFGIKTDGCDLFVTLHPCCDCAKLVASAGIKRIFYIDDGSDMQKSDDWRKLLNHAKTIFAESGIVLKPVREIEKEESTSNVPSKWCGSVARYSDLSTVPNRENGDIYFCMENKIAYRYNGVQWVTLSYYQKI